MAKRKCTVDELFAHVSQLVAWAREEDFRTLIGRLNRRDYLKFARSAYGDAIRMAMVQERARCPSNRG